MNQDLKKTLWAAADKLRSSMDAAEYKHIVLGLIFLKYISDAFDERRAQLQAAFVDPAHDLHLPDTADHAEALEERDYYTMVNTFWVPAQARWEAIRAQAKQADIGVRIFDAPSRDPGCELHGLREQARLDPTPQGCGTEAEWSSRSAFGYQLRLANKSGSPHEIWHGIACGHRVMSHFFFLSTKKAHATMVG